jgi:hypothetical protein
MAQMDRKCEYKEIIIVKIYVFNYIIRVQTFMQIWILNICKLIYDELAKKFPFFKNFALLNGLYLKGKCSSVCIFTTWTKQKLEKFSEKVQIFRESSKKWLRAEGGLCQECVLQSWHSSPCKWRTMFSPITGFLLATRVSPSPLTWKKMASRVHQGLWWQKCLVWWAG